ncbi:EAL domain-containing protein [Fictibacillus iocasae]|uniref:EAL domain-containing protein n=1 Tax=Fictibacillus iocasae TaxID=2715437 RepID=A0ABW2NWU1_9BACL
MTCSACLHTPAIPDKGIMVVSHPNPSIMSNLKLASQPAGEREFPYHTLKEAEDVLAQLENEYSRHALEHFSFHVEEDGISRMATSVPFFEWKERILRPDLVSVITNELFTTHYQPILHLLSEGIYGYELLLRPIEGGPAFYPYELFQFAERAGLQSLLDSRARVAAIRNSAPHIQKGIKRFINFLPSSIYDPNHCLKTTFHAAAETGTDPADLIFEVVETEEILDMNHLQTILEVYKEKGMKVALDDLGAGHSTEEVLVRLKPNYVKIDRDLISFCDANIEKQQKIKNIIKTSSDIHTLVLAEGIERKEEADWCRLAGIQLAQGYYFGRPSSADFYFQQNVTV